MKKTIVSGTERPATAPTRPAASHPVEPTATPAIHAHRAGRRFADPAGSRIPPMRRPSPAAHGRSTVGRPTLNAAARAAAGPGTNRDHRCRTPRCSSPGTLPVDRQGVRGRPVGRSRRASAMPSGKSAHRAEATTTSTGPRRHYDRCPAGFVLEVGEVAPRQRVGTAGQVEVEQAHRRRFSHVVRCPPADGNAR